MYPEGGHRGWGTEYWKGGCERQNPLLVCLPTLMKKKVGVGMTAIPPKLCSCAYEDWFCLALTLCATAALTTGVVTPGESPGDSPGIRRRSLHISPNYTSTKTTLQRRCETWSHENSRHVCFWGGLSSTTPIIGSKHRKSRPTSDNLPQLECSSP